MLLHELVETSRRLSGTTRRLEKIEALTGLLVRLAPDEIAIGVAYLSGNLPQGRIGIGPAAVRRALPETASPSPSLELSEVHKIFSEITTISGAGSVTRRGQLLRQVLARGTSDEQKFLARLVLGEVRQGALEGIMVEALARSTKISSREVRRAVMVSGDLGAVAVAALREGAVVRFRVELFRPIQPMLAQTADDVGAVFERLDTAAFEYKMDGARIQVHKSGDEVRVFTRRLNDVTAACPEVVEAVRAADAREIILDGEVLALRENGSPHPFQVTMKRFGRKLDIARMRESLPLSAYFFDCLFLDGEELFGRRAEERFEALADALPRDLLIPRTVIGDADEASAFVGAALEAGHEGVMAKSLDATYDAGSRGYGWLKLKPFHTLDLVVLAAEWGGGRRRGWLSNLHLGARNPVTGEFVMLGKTFKGLTDEMLKWQTRRLQDLEVSRDEWTVFVRPELVVEVAFSDVQTSPQYPGGVALRFARVKRYRPDKTAAEADNIDTVRAIREI